MSNTTGKGAGSLKSLASKNEGNADNDKKAAKKKTASAAKTATAKKEKKERAPRKSREDRIAEREAHMEAQRKAGKRFAEPIDRLPHITFTNSSAEATHQIEISGLNYLEAVRATPKGLAPSVLDRLVRGPAICVKRVITVEKPEEGEDPETVTYEKYEPGDAGFWKVLSLITSENTTDVKFNITNA